MNLKLAICSSLVLVAGVAGAQDRDHRDRDHRDRGDRWENRGHDRDDWRRDRDDWRRDRDDWRRDRDDHHWRRDWDRDRVYIGDPYYADNTVFDLQANIDNLSIELTNLRRGPWFEGRDGRCHDLEARIHDDRDRIAFLRRR